MREQQREAFAGDARRERPIFEEKNLGPFKARVTVTPILLRRGTTFEVGCEWHGLPLPPLPDPGVPVDASDVETFAVGERAVAVARAAAAALRDGRVPDLRAGQ